MSYSDDLDWLARNVNDWPDGTCSYIHMMVIKEIKYPSWSRYDGDGKYTKAQWLARRAELQNKPSWAYAPDEAQYMAQDRDGGWGFWGREPVSRMAWWAQGAPLAEFNLHHAKRLTGEVLGDWRDTLERRPADLSELAVTERLTEATQNLLAVAPALMDEKYSFEPEFMPVSVSHETVQLERPIAVAGTGNGSASESAFLIGRVIDLLRTSVDHFSADELADLNELTCAELTKRDDAVCGGQKYIDAHWFDRGELPPVGTECEAATEGCDYEKCEILAFHKGQVALRWFEFNGGCLDVLELDGWTFRPIRTERDEAIKAMKAHCPYPGSWETTYRLFAESLYDAGYRAGGFE